MLTSPRYTVEKIDADRWRIVGPGVGRTALYGLLGFPLQQAQAERVVELLDRERAAGRVDLQHELVAALGLANSPDGIVQRGTGE